MFLPQSVDFEALVAWVVPCRAVDFYSAKVALSAHPVAHETLEMETEATVVDIVLAVTEDAIATDVAAGQHGVNLVHYYRHP